MAIALPAALFVVMVATAFLSGIFGMAGGLVLMGILLALLPLPAAMVLHAVTQMASNGWRAWLWRRHIRWSTAGWYVSGCLATLGAWTLVSYVPDKPVAMLLLGVTPFMVRAIPERFMPAALTRVQTVASGVVCMSLLLLTGVTGPLLDTLFLRTGMDRRDIVATKAFCQIFGHLLKLVYFGALIEQAGALDPVLAGLGIAASLIGTSLGKTVLDRLSDAQFRRWSNHIITLICAYFIGHGLLLLAAGAGYV